MILRDRWGWPVETCKGHPVRAVIRYLIHTSLWQTFRKRRVAAHPGAAGGGADGE